MNSIELVPLVGAGPVRFGMSRAQVHEALGAPTGSFKKVASAIYPTDTWMHNRIQVFYGGPQPVVEFIECSGGDDLEVLCMGESVFSVPAETLVQRLSASGGTPRVSEKGCSYEVLSLELGLWRPCPEEPEGQFFSTVGIGTHGYYSDL